MRRGHAGRVDQNHAAIVHALRQAGASVQSLASIGRGCADLLVGWQGQNYLFEVKAGDARLTAAERAWHLSWAGAVVVVRSVDGALAQLVVRR